jgi:hypothetical protein
MKTKGFAGYVVVLTVVGVSLNVTANAAGFWESVLTDIVVKEVVKSGDQANTDKQLQLAEENKKAQMDSERQIKLRKERIQPYRTVFNNLLVSVEPDTAAGKTDRPAVDDYVWVLFGITRPAGGKHLKPTVSLSDKGGKQPTQQEHRAK